MHRFVAAFAFAVIAPLSSASATTFDYTYTGTIASGGFDTAGLFGAPNADLSGDAFNLAFQAHPDNAPLRQTTTNIDEALDTAGTGFLTATLTINGHAQNLVGDFVGNNNLLEAQNNAPINDVASAALQELSAQNFSFVTVELTNNTNALPGLLTTPINYTISPQDGFVGSFSLIGGEAFGQFVPSTYTVSAVSAVPIPASLPMFASGLAVLGFLVWKRRKASAPA